MEKSWRFDIDFLYCFLLARVSSNTCPSPFILLYFFYSIKYSNCNKRDSFCYKNFLLCSCDKNIILLSSFPLVAFDDLSHYSRCNLIKLRIVKLSQILVIFKLFLPPLKVFVSACMHYSSDLIIMLSHTLWVTPETVEHINFFVLCTLTKTHGIYFFIQAVPLTCAVCCLKNTFFTFFYFYLLAELPWQHFTSSHTFIVHVYFFVCCLGFFMAQVSLAFFLILNLTTCEWI